MYWLLCADFFKFLLPLYQHQLQHQFIYRVLWYMEITAVLNFMNELTKTIIKSHIIAVLFTLDSKKMN